MKRVTVLQTRRQADQRGGRGPRPGVGQRALDLVLKGKTNVVLARAIDGLDFECDQVEVTLESLSHGLPPLRSAVGSAG